MKVKQICEFSGQGNNVLFWAKE